MSTDLPQNAETFNSKMPVKFTMGRSSYCSKKSKTPVQMKTKQAPLSEIENIPKKNGPGHDKTLNHHQRAKVKNRYIKI